VVSSIESAVAEAARWRAGSVYINTYARDDLSMPFGGYGESGIGVDKSLYALDNYTRLKSVWVDLAV
jgi:acyl-CoA reductase-like NAD-dependent aldehyde dehydrogenase